MRDVSLALAFGLSFTGSSAELINRAISQWLWPSAITVGNYLYVTGGEQYFPSSNTILHEPGTYVVDLTSSWTNETIVPVGGQPVSSPSDLRPSRQPLLFYDAIHKSVHRWAGWPYDGDDYPTTVWSFTPGSGTVDWNQGANVSSNASSSVSSGPFAAAIAYSNTTYFNLGGNIKATNAEANMTVLPGLVMQDFDTQTWNNVSFNLYAQTQFRTEARAAYMPNFGTKGYLVAVGGENPVTEGSVYETGFDMADMSDITLYDVGTGAWYQQTATGEVPPPRSEFCAVGAASQGDTFELFIYGGAVNSTDDANKPDDDGYLNVYALSIPAFRWFQSNSSTITRRAAHACSKIGNRQMISIGGRLVNTATALGLEQDPWTSSIGVFDMTAFAWSDAYDPAAAAYESPDQVKQYYSSEYQTPTWADPALAKVFHYEAQNASSNSTSPNPANSKSNSTPSGAIAGGVVGGVAGIALVCLAIWLWLRRRRRQSASTEDSYPEDGKTPYTDPEPAAPTYEVEGRVYNKVAPAELSSNPDVIAELPGHGAESRGDHGTDSRELRNDAFHGDSDGRK